MRSTRALIHTDNLRHNIRIVRQQIGPGRLICAAVKADGYGHGAAEVAEIAREEGVTHFAVATVGEGVLLRKQGLTAPLLLFTLPQPEETPEIAAHDIQPFTADTEYVSLLQQEAEKQGRVVRVHLHIDTGMGRIGCQPENAAAMAVFIKKQPNVQLAGVSTHFACADSADRAFTDNQLKRFKQALEEIRRAGVEPGIVHASNSAAILEYPESWFDMVRPGIMMYGYYPGNEQPRNFDLKPVMELRTKVVYLKKVPAGQPLSYGAVYRTPQETVVATLPVGYADGYNRLLSSKGPVLIRGKHYTVSGRVCMDQFMVDLGPDSGVELYDDVVLFGPDPHGPTAEDIAKITGTIPYEVTCSINKRVPRIYL